MYVFLANIRQSLTKRLCYAFFMKRITIHGLDWKKNGTYLGLTSSGETQR